MWTLDKIKALCKSIGVKEAVEIVAKDIGRTKALAMIDGQELVDADGVAVDIQTITLETGGGEEEGEGEAEGEGEGVANTDPDANKTIASAVAKAVASEMAKHIKANSPINGEIHEARVVPAKVKRCRVKNFTGPDAEYKAYGFGQVIQFARGVKSAGEWLGNQGLLVKAQIEGDDSKGGVLVPELFSSDIIRLVEEFGVFRTNARVMPMSSETLRVPRVLSEGAATFGGEAVTISTTDDEFDSVLLVAKKLRRMTRVSSELLDDSIIAMGDLLARSFATQFAFKEDSVGFNGTASAADGGITGITVKIDDGTHTASVIGALAGNDSFEDLDLVDFENAVGKLPEFPGLVPKWYISKVGFYASMSRLMLGQSGSSAAEAAEGSPRRFLGIDVVFSQVLNKTLGTNASTVVALLGDLSMSSTLGDRASMSIVTSEERYFDTDETAIRGISRLDIVNHDLGDNTDAGPIVAVKTSS